ncbi:MAG TPA: ATP-binding protein, partial [Blastocatellia bacterium]|nr:ATP-binding protein [Blastocatellia bacterium]
ALGFIPLIYQGRLMGKFMLYYNTAHAFTEEEVQIARTIAGHVAFAIERQRAADQLRASEERFFKAFSANPNAMSIRRFDDGRYVEVNDSFLRLTGFTREEVIGHNVAELGIMADADDLSRIRQMLSEKGSVQDFEFTYRAKSGEARVALMSAEVIDLNREPHVLVVTTDITERKRAREELARLLAREKKARREAEQSKKLQAELLRREENARVSAEAANRAKDEFLATVSHELRTPLTPMLGWAQMLRGRKVDEDTLDYALEAIERNVKSQAQLIDDILDVSRIVTGKLRLDVRPVALSQVVRTALDMVRLAADARAIHIETAFDLADDQVLGDPDRLQQVMWNLLSNAIKFTPMGGRVGVRLERAGANARITVSDTGQGISPELLPYVFDRFWQADSSPTRQHGGLGLGLALVRHLVEMHGGTARADSPGEGQGATFTLSLPLLAHKESGKAPASVDNKLKKENALALDGLRLIVVEDEPDTLEMLRVVLEQNGAKVKACASAGEASAWVQRWNPDAVISDIGMPEEDGYEFMRRVRALEGGRGAQIPAIALTAYAGPEDRERALAAGYQKHLAKPVEARELIQAVAGLARRKGEP